MNKDNNKYNEPRVTVSKKACKCDETGKDIQKGATVLFVPKTGTIYHPESKAYKAFAKSSKPAL